MSQISTLFAHKVAAASFADQTRRRALLQSVEIDPDAPVDPKRMIPADVYYDLCERVARMDPDGVSLPLRVGSSMRCDDYGAFGLAWKSAVDLRRSYHRAERYGRVLTSVAAYELRSENGRLFMMLHREGARRLGMRMSNEQTIVAITEISREVSRDGFQPVAVHFRHPSPGDVTAHEAYFGAPVQYGSDRDALEVSEASIDAPNRLGDAGLSKFFDAHLDQEVAALAPEPGLDHQVKAQISQALSDGAPSVAIVAERLGMSGRTLQRRLAERERAFQDLVDEARRELAERLLQRTDYALAEVAFLTGFSEQSAFTRAFRRWNGLTPARFRKDAPAA